MGKILGRKNFGERILGIEFERVKFWSGDV